MARIRSMKPELRDSLLVASWPFEVRYFFTLLWGYLDDSGRGLDMPKRIAGDCFPHDDITAEDIDKWLDMMTYGIEGKHGPICRYRVAGRDYIHSVNWDEHQKPNRPTPSRLPRCPMHESLSEGLSEGLSESLNGNSLPGAAEQQSRGAGEQQQTRRESLTEVTPATEQAVRIIIDATGVTPELATEVALVITRERKPRNLPGLVRSLVTSGDLGEWFLKAEKAINGRAVTSALDRARASPPCRHGDPGGDLPHPATGHPICPQCRREAPP